MTRTLEQIIALENSEVVTEAKRKAELMLFDIHLTELRELRNKTQEDIARVSVKQPIVAGKKSNLVRKV